MKRVGREGCFQCPDTYYHVNVFTIIICANVQYRDLCPHPKWMIVKHGIEHRKNTTFYEQVRYTYSSK